MAPSFVCEKCWIVLDVTQQSRATCPECASPAPQGGFAPMPFRYKRRFLFVEQLGRGGQGAVFRATDLAEEVADGAERSEVAVKVVQTLAYANPTDPDHSRNLAAFNDEARRRFDLESRAAGMFGSSPRFVDVLAYEKGALPHLVMEYVRWPTLSRFVADRRKQKQSLSAVEVAALGRELLAGVAVMHAHSVIHRDLKPSNLFVDSGRGDWQVKITDLGIWTRSGDQEQGIEASLNPNAPAQGRRRMPQGTPAWMSPEQQRCEALGPPSDLHAVGAILWWALTGAAPFPGNRSLLDAANQARSPEERAFAFEQYFAERLTQMRAPPPRPAPMPEALYAVIARALAFTPAQRFQRAAEFRDALDAFIAGEAERSRAALDEAHRRVSALHHLVGEMGIRLRAFEALARARQDHARDVASLEADLENPGALDLPLFLDRIAEAERAVATTQATIQREITSSLPPSPPPPAPVVRPAMPRWAPATALAIGVLGLAGGIWIGRATNTRPAHAAEPTVTTPPPSRPPADAAVAPRTTFLRAAVASNPFLPVPGASVRLQQHEVSRREYLLWLRTQDASALRPWSPTADADADDDTPVTNVTPVEARRYCEALGGRLPNEGTWDALVTTWPSEAPALLPSTWPHSVRLPVAADVAPSGHRDLLSNVSEWVESPNGSSLRRGGSFRLAGADAVDVARHASPHEGDPAMMRLAYTGFRCEL